VISRSNDVTPKEILINMFTKNNVHLQYISFKHTVNMYRTTSLFITACFLLGLIQAQESDPKIQFDKMLHDFGTVQQNDPTETVFAFTNVSDEPVKLTRVKASCGCTTPSYTQEAVAPGETGEINVKYNSARVGAFNKSVSVYYDSVLQPIVLRIRGTVDKPAEAVIYNHTVGGLAMDKIQADIPDLKRNQTYKNEFNIKNISPVKINFTEKFDKPEPFDVTISPTSLTPGQTATVTINTIGEKWGQGGEFSETITLYTDEAEQAAKSFTITGKAEPSAEEMATAPSIEFEKTAYDGGKAIEGEKITYAYKFTNTGKSDLKIESVKASCGCTASAPKDEIISPGQASEIVATFNSQGRIGKQSKSITVRTNDPEQPVVKLYLTVEVERDPFQVGSDEGAPINGSGSNRR